jgi:hypothetical protein
MHGLKIVIDMGSTINKEPGYDIKGKIIELFGI